jgi:septal ring factor EnvC (AmiA/AmiB activator)
MKRLAAALPLLVALASSRSDAAPSGGPTDPTLALAALDRKIADLDAEEIDTKKELGDLGPRIQQARVRTVKKTRAFYKLSRAGLLPVGGGFDALVSHAMRVERARRSLESGLEEERRLREHGVELAQTLERVARDREALSSQRSALDAARIAMAEEQQRKSAFRKAFESSEGSSEYVAVYGGSALEPVTSGFAASRGRLLFPVAGRSDVRPARREGADGPGLEIIAPHGAPVRAVFGGRVAFADRYGAYGRIVILDHGDHYYTVSGNLGAVDVRVGDELSAGERIGSVGDDGHGPMLYFEIRHGSQTIAPQPWLGL